MLTPLYFLCFLHNFIFPPVRSFSFYVPDFNLFPVFLKSLGNIFQFTNSYFSSLLFSPFSELLYFNDLFFTIANFYLVLFQIRLFLPYGSICTCLKFLSSRSVRFSLGGQREGSVVSSYPFSW